MKKYFYKLLFKYVSLFCLEENSITEIYGKSKFFSEWFKNYFQVSDLSQVTKIETDYVLLNGILHYEKDIQKFLEDLNQKIQDSTRVIIIYYSSLWKPLTKLANLIRLRETTPEQNWLANEDIDNLLLLSNFELVRREQKVLFPLYFPLLSNLINHYLAPLPFFRIFCMVNIAVARRIPKELKKDMSVSIVVPARNEEGNIENIVRRIPKMGPDDELIFIEGNSTDNTWKKIQEVTSAYKGDLKIKIAQQDGKGKGDAVRKGFSLAEKEILMILDADLTVPPEDLPKFYKAIVQGKGEFINGSRLVYPMEKKAMRFFNMLGNKFFAMAFSFVLGQRFKDTLCGTKVISRENYLKLAKNRSYFGEFDPFGDFDLIFGSARMGLKIVEVPIAYKERTYGDTNISRWKHGAILLAMLVFAARKIKFL
ncbi:MAG: glycosyltransferase family 2 protein [Leptospiraceae bacterium]|nr:glycosyltransferase family 2 protein [Leptospiraceae bacterium]